MPFSVVASPTTPVTFLSLQAAAFCELDVFWRQVHADVGLALRRKVHGIMTGGAPQLDHGGEGADIVRDMFFGVIKFELCVSGLGGPMCFTGISVVCGDCFFAPYCVWGLPVAGGEVAPMPGP